MPLMLSRMWGDIDVPLLGQDRSRNATVKNVITDGAH